MVQLQLDKKQDGFVSMLTIVLLMVIVITMSITIMTVLIDSNLSYGVVADSVKARANADSCVEIAINKLKESTSYTGANELVTTDYGSCTIVSVLGTGNTNREINVTGTFNNVTRRVRVTVTTVNPDTVISSWLEVDI
jgi:hypothetical protein